MVLLPQRHLGRGPSVERIPSRPRCERDAAEPRSWARSGEESLSCSGIKTAGDDAQGWGYGEEAKSNRDGRTQVASNSSEGALDAEEDRHGKDGRHSKVDVSSLVSKQRRGQVRLNMWQLPADFEEDELLEVATDFGRVISHDLWSEKNQMCAMVEYETREQALAALGQIHNRKMEGWHMLLKTLVCD